MRRATAVTLVALACSPGVYANETTQQMPALMGSMARFAQPVRVGDLAHRDVLRPEYEQRVLGYVAPDAVVQAGNGTLFLVVDWGGVFGIGATRVVVPLSDLALLGEHVVYVHTPVPRLASLRRFNGAVLAALPADREIKMMIVGPFH